MSELEKITPEDFDRSAEDPGNIVGLEHVNVQVGDQRLATLFNVTGLGLTRAPLPSGQCHDYVDQCGAQPVPPAHKRAPGTAGPDRAGDA